MQNSTLFNNNEGENEHESDANNSHGAGLLLHPPLSLSIAAATVHGNDKYRGGRGRRCGACVGSVFDGCIGCSSSDDRFAACKGEHDGEEMGEELAALEKERILALGNLCAALMQACLCEFFFCFFSGVVLPSDF